MVPASLKRFIRLNETESCLSRRRLYDGLVCGPVPVSETESARVDGTTGLGYRLRLGPPLRSPTSLEIEELDIQYSYCQ